MIQVTQAIASQLSDLDRFIDLVNSADPARQTVAWYAYGIGPPVSVTARIDRKLLLAQARRTRNRFPVTGEKPAA